MNSDSFYDVNSNDKKPSISLELDDFLVFYHLNDSIFSNDDTINRLSSLLVLLQEENKTHELKLQNQKSEYEQKSKDLELSFKKKERDYCSHINSLEEEKKKLITQVNTMDKKMSQFDSIHIIRFRTKDFESQELSGDMINADYFSYSIVDDILNYGATIISNTSVTVEKGMRICVLHEYAIPHLEIVDYEYEVNKNRLNSINCDPIWRYRHFTGRSLDVYSEWNGAIIYNSNHYLKDNDIVAIVISDDSWKSPLSISYDI